MTLIDRYTRESGVRELDKRLAKITRVTAKKIASEIIEVELTQPMLEKILGPPKYIRDIYAGNDLQGLLRVWHDPGRR